MSEKLYALPNVQSPGLPVKINSEKCVGCNTCVQACPLDVYIPNPQKGKQPIILHPDECWYCGVCATECPTPGAIAFNYPLALKPRWRNKETGEVFQVR